MKGGGKGYLIRQGWHNMAANRLMTVASIGVLSACLIITGIALLISANVNRIVDYLGDQNEIVAYVRDDATPEEIEQLGQQLTQTENVERWTYVSKEDALEEMKSWMEDYGELLEGYGTILPASYRVTVVDLSLIDQTTQVIAALDAVESAETPSEVASVMVVISNAVTYGGWGLVILLGLVSIIVISNTIRLTVYSRRREIMIMKYVGATNGFIRLPFFVEGITVGAISGLISSGLVIAAYTVVYKYITGTQILGIINLVSNLYKPGQIWYILLVIFVVFGAIVGVVGTLSSIRKHLKV